MRQARTRRATFIASGMVAMAMTVQAAPAATITVAPNEPETQGNCYPFGQGVGWTPYAAWIYKNVPAFELVPGETLAFDLAAVNDADVQLDIALARTASNGAPDEAEAFQTVVTNTQTPANPRGDTTVGNFELQFTAEVPFSFPGGGLIIRFSNPSTAFAADSSCDNVIRGGSSTDSSGFFVERGYADPNGAYPWQDGDTDSIGAFRVVTTDPPPPDTDPPETTITKDAPKKTDKSKIKFKFVSDEPGSTFECKADKKPYKPCSSPRTLKRLDEGKHKFKVRAIDAAGNVDPTPDKDKFKVVG